VVRDLPTWTQRFDVLDRFLLARLDPAPAVSPEVRYAWQRLRSDRERLGCRGARLRRHPSAADGLGARRHRTVHLRRRRREGHAAAKEFAGDRDVDVAAGQVGSQALKLGLIDQVVVNQVPVVFGSGRPFFATGGLAEPLRLENPTTIVRGDRVTHLVYDVSR